MYKGTICLKMTLGTTTEYFVEYSPGSESDNQQLINQSVHIN